MGHHTIEDTEAADMVVAEAVAQGLIRTDQECHLPSISPITTVQDLLTTINHIPDMVVISQQCLRLSVNNSMRSRVQWDLQQ